MRSDIITTDKALAELCRVLADADQIAFDTEFVSEFTYRPELCLVQVAAGETLALIDAMAVRDLAPFWRLLTSAACETVVHAGREEVLFCLEAVGQPPGRLFDVQLAAGLIGLEYPAGYGSLISRLLGEKPQKGETRTDWRRRPLTTQQQDYALADVLHLGALRARLAERLDRLGRWSWFTTEMTTWIDDIQSARTRERWRRVAGSSSLPPRALAIVREVWQWRESEAERRDCSVRRVLRDDLIVEIAKRRLADPRGLRAVRGMERRDLAPLLPALGQAVERALNLPEAECPTVIRSETSPQLTMLGQFLSSALSSICRDAEVASTMVGTAGDVRDFVAYQLANDGAAGRELPVLARGWRAEVVGRILADLLSGQLSIRIADPASEQPLRFDRHSM